MKLEFESYSLYGNDALHHDAIKEDWYMMCAAWKWLDKKRVHTVATYEDKTRFKNNHRDDYHVVKTLRDVVASADLVIGHNLDRFDLKKLNSRIVEHGLEPLIMPASVDTLKAAKKYCKFSSNRLDYIAKILGVDRKIRLPLGTVGKAESGDKKALKALVDYNKGDIICGEAVYLKLKNHIHNHPSIAKILGYKDKKGLMCDACGSTDLIWDGRQRLKTGVFRYTKCKSCGYRSKGPKVKDERKGWG